MGPLHQRIEIGDCAENRVDPAKIRDVVTKIPHRRCEEGRDPDCIDAQIGDMAEPLGNSGQITHAIAVGIGETSRINLVDHRPAPPVGALGVLLSVCHGSRQCHRADVPMQMA